ncbi:MAG: CBS domain-containing protein [Thermomicrobia bacterium]|nr:CBS domain-containing protein [Thermomicrobia bacterium]
MSPRAAWRLESLGFTVVYDYVPGEADWVANGLPTEGEASGKPRAGTIAKRDVPTCSLTDTVGAVRARIEGTGWDVCVVVNGERVALGLLGEKVSPADAQTPVETVMESGPSTWRLSGSLADIEKYMDRHGVTAVIITGSDGRLYGAVRREDIPQR